MRIPLSIIIPVGPKSYHREWLAEAIESVREQKAHPDDEIVLINDGGDSLLDFYSDHTFNLPFCCGATAAWNIGVTIAYNEHVVMLGSDDKLMPNCLDKIASAWEYHKEPLGYYYLSVRYSDGREDQGSPCQAVMVTKSLWRYTGGFPIECALGAIDNIFLQMLKTGADRGVSKAKLIKVSPEPLYWYRVHPETETNLRSARWLGIIPIVRQDLAMKWMPNESWRCAEDDSTHASFP